MEVLQQIQECFFTDGRYRKLGRFKNQIIWTASAISGVLSFSFAFYAERAGFFLSIFALLNLDMTGDFEEGKGPRTVRCGSCSGCQGQDCGSCANCLDKPRFGGSGAPPKTEPSKISSAHQARLGGHDDARFDVALGRRGQEARVLRAALRPSQAA